MLVTVMLGVLNVIVGAAGVGADQLATIFNTLFAANILESIVIVFPAL